MSRLMVLLFLMGWGTQAVEASDAFPIFQLVGSDERVSFEQGLVYFEDSSDQMSAQDIWTLAPSRFQQIPPGSFLGHRKHSVWLRFGLLSPKERTVYLELQNPLLDELDFCFTDAQRNWKCHNMGLKVEHDSTRIEYWTYTTDVILPAGEVKPVVMRLRDIGMLQVPLRLLGESDFYQENHNRMWKNGFFYGILIGCSLLIFLSWILFRESFYLYYLVMMGAFLLFVSAHNGAGARFFSFIDLTPWESSFNLIFTLLLSVSTLVFTRRFLEVDKYYPHWAQVMGWSTLPILIAIGLVPWLDAFYSNQMVLSFSLLGVLMIFGSGIIMLWKSRQAWLFLIGFLPPTVIAGLYAWSHLVSVDALPITLDSFYWSFLFMVMLLGLGMARRVQMIRQEQAQLRLTVVENLRRADLLKDEFLANTSHELKTPLNGIIGIIEGMLSDSKYQLSAKIRRSLLLIVHSGHRLSHLINDVLDFSKLRDGCLEMHLKAVSVRHVSAMVVSLMLPLCRKKTLELTNAVPLDLPGVWADEDRLQQILTNLVGNAIKFTETGSVRIEACVQGSYVMVTVTDTGMGIPAESFERIFEMFHQVDASIARTHGGTGIGLSLCRKLLNLMRGRIWVESKLGQGSQFHFTLPLSREGVMAQGGSVFQEMDVFEEELPLLSSQGPSDTSPCILLVDDEPVNLQVLVNQLGAGGYNLSLAATGQEALQLLQGGLEPDLILLDLMMPGLSGFDVCLQIRETWDASHLPIILMTAKNQMKELIRGLELGANDYLPKPFTKAELLARVRVHLNLGALHKSYARFVPQEFLHHLQRENIAQVQLGDQHEQYLAVLISDIRDFTHLSERISPQETFSFLNEYLEQMAPLIRKHGGFVSKFLGDSIIALFPAGAQSALDAALDMSRSLDEFNQRNAERLNFTVRCGIGLHVGKAILGTVGYQSRMDVTVVSQKLTQAKALEQLTKVFGAHIIVSADLLRLLVHGGFDSRLLGRMSQNGREEPLEFFEILSGNADEVRKTLAVKGVFVQGVKLYWLGEMDEARSAFEDVVRNNPKDVAALAYLRQGRLPMGASSADVSEWEVAS